MQIIQYKTINKKSIFCRTNRADALLETDSDDDNLVVDENTEVKTNFGEIFHIHNENIMQSHQQGTSFPLL